MLVFELVFDGESGAKFFGCVDCLYLGVAVSGIVLLMIFFILVMRLSFLSSIRKGQTIDGVWLVSTAEMA